MKWLASRWTIYYEEKTICIRMDFACVVGRNSPVKWMELIIALEYGGWNTDTQNKCVVTNNCGETLSHCLLLNGENSGCVKNLRFPIDIYLGRYGTEGRTCRCMWVAFRRIILRKILPLKVTGSVSLVKTANRRMVYPDSACCFTALTNSNQNELTVVSKRTSETGRILTYVFA